jgi:transposase
MINAGMAHSTAYKYYDIMVTHGTLEDARKLNSRPNSIDEKTKSRLLRAAKNKDNVSVRQLANKFNLSKSTVHRQLTSMGLKYHKKRACPKYTDKQLAEVKIATGHLYRDFFAKRPFPICVMDDESYIDLDGYIQHGISGYYTDNVSTAPDSVKYQPKSKWPGKIGFWYALSDRGFSDIFIFRSGLAINAERYIQCCIRERLVPFIDQHHERSEILFWPDKASAHYANATLRELQALQIPTVPKKCNPTNLPQARPIETIHALLKDKVFRNQSPPQSVEELEIRLRYAYNELKCDHYHVTHNFTQKIRSLLNTVYRQGVLSIQK